MPDRPTTPEPAPVAVFVCDDSEAFRELLSLQLEGTGCQVVGGGGGPQDCAPAIGVASPDVVLVDHGVAPPGNWEGFVAELRAAAPQAPIVLLSGLPRDFLARQAQIFGLDGSLHKDEPPLRLAALILDVVGAETAP